MDEKEQRTLLSKLDHLHSAMQMAEAGRISAVLVGMVHISLGELGEVDFPAPLVERVKAVVKQRASEIEQRLTAEGVTERLAPLQPEAPPAQRPVPPAPPVPPVPPRSVARPAPPPVPPRRR